MGNICYKSTKEYYKKNNFIFDYKKEITPLLYKSDSNKKNIILLTTGSFNPIHRMHLELLNIAYKHLLSLKNYNILCAFISPSCDNYVKTKQPPLIPFNIRCQMIQASIEEFNKENINKENDILNIMIHKWEGSQKDFIDFPYVIKEIQIQLNQLSDIQLLYVCGMDHYNKCKYDLERNVIVVDRKPFKNVKYENIENKMVFFIRDEYSEPISSTSIREFYKNDYLNNIKKATFDTVGDMIIDFYDKHKEEFE